MTDPPLDLLRVFYLVVVALGLGAFLLNASRFSWSRFLPFVVLAVFWAILMRFNLYFGMVFAAALAVNGQEWYHDRLGTEGRLGWEWTLWSTGGRLVTLALIFLMVAKRYHGLRYHSAGHSVRPRISRGRFPVRSGRVSGRP